MKIVTDEYIALLAEELGLTELDALRVIRAVAEVTAMMSGDHPEESLTRLNSALKKFEHSFQGSKHCLDVYAAGNLTALLKELRAETDGLLRLSAITICPEG